MDILLTIIHLAACFILIVIVLLQKGKGADLAGAFGGGGTQTAMGVRSATQIIHKLTIAAAVFFMITSYTLGLIQSAGQDFLSQVGDEAARQSTSQSPLQNIRTATGEEEQETQADENQPGLSTPESEEENPPADEDNSSGGDGDQEPFEPGN